jgi:hypothetical protein
MRKSKKIQRWDEVNGLVIEDGGSLETPEEQAEGPALTNPVWDNPLQNAEMEAEDDYNQIDGFINNGEKKDPEEELATQQKSVKEKLLENEKKLKEQTHEPVLVRKDPLCPDRNLC